MKPKNALTSKRTPPAKKPAAKGGSNPPAESGTPSSAATTHGSVTKMKLENCNNSTPSSIGSDSKSGQASVVEEAQTPGASASVTPDAKVAPRKRVVRKVVRVFRKVPANRTPAMQKVVSAQTPTNEEDALKSRVDERKKEEVVERRDSENSQKEKLIEEKVGEFREDDQTNVEIGRSLVGNVAKFATEGHSDSEKKASIVEVFEESAQEQPMTEVVVSQNVIAKSFNDDEPDSVDKGQEVKEEPKKETVDIDISRKDKPQGEDAQDEQNDFGVDEVYEEYGDRVDFEDHGEDDLEEEDPEEDLGGAETFDEERKELTAIAKERKIKKEYEIFVGGLDREATEEDVRKVFQNVGDVVEVRLHRNLSINKNKGYAFVKFANKEHAKRALMEMKNPVIHGKRCGTAPSEDNDTLFLGNICNTWTKEAIRQKLKDYGIEGVESITLVPDVQHEGRSRGFAFLEFSCHAEAMTAYKRLQKPDVVFGHSERTAKVAFAEPIREPDPEVMAQVKTVFLDGLPPHWDEDRVRELLQGFGEIVRVVLARNMSTAKRKDFGFVDFSSHESAVVCIEGINNKELDDGNSKIRVKARLSNPLPKTQAVKGGMRGGFLIDRAGNGSFSRFGRAVGRGGRHFNWPNFQRGRGFYHRGRGQSSRMGPHEYEFVDRYAAFQGRQFDGRGGRRGPPRGGYHDSAGSSRGGYHDAVRPSRGGYREAVGPSRSNFNRPWHDAPAKKHEHFVHPRRQPFSPETFDRPFGGRPLDDPYFYGDGSRGMKRPFYMADHEPDYPEPSRLRPRMDYGDPSISFHGSRYHDTYGASTDPYSRDYYGSDYGTYPPYYGNDRTYGGGYYY
ncbi:hypothetical protein K2173_006272 [Erythroxylum novogranatense]|uniref:RRM domain-containing protein n=1 Tax=Erythroxylum novogranatense TaxID=1862640 RepID=A0AAV8TCD3_9ROSI|nr:hypothetical protein K2173_006272 [Erythroxylum novogranatense]